MTDLPAAMRSLRSALRVLFSALISAGDKVAMNSLYTVRRCLISSGICSINFDFSDSGSSLYASLAFARRYFSPAALRSSANFCMNRLYALIDPDLGVLIGFGFASGLVTFFLISVVDLVANDLIDGIYLSMVDDELLLLVLNWVNAYGWRMAGTGVRVGRIKWNREVEREEKRNRL